MNIQIKESDWKYLRSIFDEMLQELCSRINNQAAEIALAEDGSPHEQYRKLYRHIKDSDKNIADCFNDWRRSNIKMKILSLRKHGLLLDEHVRSLSNETQEWLLKAE